MIFDGCRIVGPSILERNGRLQITIISNGVRRNMTYARYLMCVKEDRILIKDEVVHHKDGDCTNDSLDNLEIVSRSEHPKIHNDNKIKYKEYTTVCPNCVKPFVMTNRKQINLKSNKLNRGDTNGPFCSRKCSAQYRFKEVK